MLPVCAETVLARTNVLIQGKGSQFQLGSTQASNRVTSSQEESFVFAGGCNRFCWFSHHRRFYCEES